MSPRFLTVEQLAERLHVSANAVYIMNSRGTGPKVTKIGRRVRYLIEDVEAWEQASSGGEDELAA